MFDLIDDFDEAKWKDIGPPPNDLTTIENFTDYIDLQIVTRNPHPVAKEITYKTADGSGKDSRNVIVKDTKSAKFDPLKKVGHFYALLAEQDAEKKIYVATSILLDLDWITRKE